jgi:hypothetical protein
MKTRDLIIGALVVVGVVFAMKGCLSSDKAPDERLAGRFEALCDIARANVETPEKGVRKLGRYLGKHTGDLLGEFGDTLAAIETIADDGKHDQRALQARRRIGKPLRACEMDWVRFGDAVDRDPAASALVERFSIRLNRTLEILFGEGRRFDFATLPRDLGAAFDTTVR